MTVTLRSAGIVLLVALPLPAQATTAVSPTYYANAEAPLANGFPFSRMKPIDAPGHGPH